MVVGVSFVDVDVSALDFFEDYLDQPFGNVATFLAVDAGNILDDLFFLLFVEAASCCGADVCWHFRNELFG